MLCACVPACMCMCACCVTKVLNFTVSCCECHCSRKLGECSISHMKMPCQPVQSFETNKQKKMIFWGCFTLISGTIFNTFSVQESWTLVKCHFIWFICFKWLHLSLYILLEIWNLLYCNHLSSLQAPNEAKPQTSFRHWDQSFLSHLNSF